MANPTVSTFSQAVVGAMRKLYPEKLADSSFDNTGLLLEAPYRPGHLKNSALLTVDLTRAVADEAIARKDSIIIAYHPIIFRPLKALTQSNTQQSTLLRLAQEGISVYSPHTALDAAENGLNDFLVACITAETPMVNGDPTGFEQHHSSVLTPIKDPPQGFETAGYGRIVRFHKPQTLGDIIARITSNLKLPGISVAAPQTTPAGERDQIKISSVGICAGSGSMLNGLDVDLLFTGELSHHEALAAIEKGKCVITTFHSNSERRFLEARLLGQLDAATKKEVEELGKKGQWEESLTKDFTIAASKADRDPFVIVMRE
ncbi:NIF3-like protein [Lachnellula hyalina]|uniref:NIF3-like protein n=1 Tax=Lachnellula hyalina TaxID=1316788 RepID=A0A8H8TXZ7_9HELO|nr:NIF3-like protein [Lachnellula hyalina]TVY24835.1 NIF3-like protein [Lachnellula hyalina]